MVTIKQIRQKIVDWQDDTITKEELQGWGEDIRFEANLSEEEEFIGIEVIAYLEFININLTTKEDIPYVLNYLDTAKPYKDEAYNKWNRYLKGIDYKKRAKELKDDQFYAPFCR